MIFSLLIACSSPPLWADVVVDAPGATGANFGDPTRATNGARGGGDRSGGTDVYSMGLDAGVNDTLVLSWSGGQAVDGPGADLVVFENPFDVASGGRFFDPLLVEVSADGDAWFAFPVDYLAADELAWSADPSAWSGFAGVSTVRLNEDTNPVDPFDAEAAGGDAFDLADVGLSAARYVRLTAAATQPNPDTDALFPRDPISNGPDIDAVYARELSP